MWSSNDNVVLDVEVITSIEDDDEPVYTDLNSRESSSDDSDYGSGKLHYSHWAFRGTHPSFLNARLIWYSWFFSNFLHFQVGDFLE